MKKQKRRFWTGTSLSFFLIGIVLFIIMGNSREVITLEQSSDYPLAYSVEEMVNNSELVVLGQYERFDTTWNMARNPNNIQQPDEHMYIEGHLYTFNIKQFLVGDTPNKSIKVNIEYLEKKSYEDEKGRTFDFEVMSPRYIKPKLNQDYILFLNYDSNFDTYYASAEPFQILIENKENVKLFSRSVQTNQLIYEKEIPLNNGDTLVVVEEIPKLQDNITGKTLDEIMEEIQKVKKEPSNISK